MKKKVLIIGYGSIGRKHAQLLKRFKNIGDIFIFSNQKDIGFKKIRKLSEVKKIQPDYIIISSRTSEHYKNLLYIERNLKNKIILVEKPLFNKFKKLNITNNKVFIGYNLRFHPVLKYIKKYIRNKKIIFVNIKCSSRLPSWRKNIDYVNSNSAKKSFGGGALLELSHEIDYLQWIFKEIKKIYLSKIDKVSNLKIDTEDQVNIIGKTLKTNFNMDLNFFSYFNERVLIINGHDFSLKGNLIENTIEIIKNKSKKKIKIFMKPNQTYIEQHKSILGDSFKNLCSYEEGKKIMLVVKKIKENEKK